MTSPWRIVALCGLLAAVVAGAVAYGVVWRFAARPASPGQHSHHSQGSGESEADFHEWMHRNLEISEAQHSELRPFEEDYEAERRRLRTKIREAGEALARAVRETGRPSAEVEGALQKLNAAQAELQQLTLRHFFTMKDHLNAEQAEKLLQWTHDSIVHNHDESR